MSKAKLRKKLEQLPKESIIKVVLTLYEASKEAKMYLDFYAEPNAMKESERFKNIIRKEFFPTRGFSEKPSFAICRKAISDFKKLKPAPEYIADIMLYYIENGCEYTMTYGDMWEQYYVTLERNFAKTMEFIFLHGLLINYYERIEKMLNATDCGWGFSDTLWDIYNQYRCS